MNVSGEYSSPIEEVPRGRKRRRSYDSGNTVRESKLPQFLKGKDLRPDIDCEHGVQPDNTPKQRNIVCEAGSLTHDDLKCKKPYLMYVKSL